MKDEDEVVKYRSKILDYNSPLVKNYKYLLVYRNNEFLLDLILEIQTYDFGVYMQARKDFRKKWFSKYKKEDYIEKVDEKIAKKKVNQSFQSSFGNEGSKKIKNLILENELMRTLSKIERPEDQNDLSFRDRVSLQDDFEQEYLSIFYGRRRQKIAKSLKTKFQLSDNQICRLQSLAYDEIISLVNKNLTACDKDQKLGVEKADVISFLERSITHWFPMFVLDMGLKNCDISLLTFRKSSKTSFNTVCWRCSRPLFKKDNRHYCTRVENRNCYEARIKESKQSDFPVAILRTKNKCDNCGKPSSLENIHKHKLKEMQFCSNKCWETFRKRYSRIK